MIACFIQYRIDAFQLEAFEEYARRWTTIIPRCGGTLVGYFVPHNTFSDEAWGVIACENLAAYERYQTALRADDEARRNFTQAREKRLILRETRTFFRAVDSIVTPQFESEMRTVPSLDR